MYTLWIDDDGTVTTTVKETIMQYSNCVDSIQILVNRYYKDTVDMSEATVYMKYTTPSGVSEKLKMTELSVNNLDYNADGTNVMQYIVPANTDITAESGKVPVSFTFILLVTDEDDNTTTYVRKTESGTIYITPVARYENYIPDELLNTIDQRLIALTAQIADLNAIRASLEAAAVNDIQISDDQSKLILINDDGTVGDGVDIDELTDIIGVAIAGRDADGTTDGITYLDETNLDDTDVEDLDDLLS